MTIHADQSSRRLAPASFGGPGRAVGTSHYTLAANFFESVRSVQVQETPGNDAVIGAPRTSLQHALHTPVSYSMALGTVAAMVCAIAVAVATFGA
ncbi:hypothetical protein SAMN05216410_0917 [Sanguibacter gelidistatuariae]|uniref:Uncharacterized protein n=1 Tax=Sanguibacter gelidistatuariae TaxID=1814289 RepID=A0A1G6HC79_9MICO|nr:hypothetical protein [Sanguibacter gelidistatuariae]SDB91870.1 hypothetical protein SAMN05216410_0917 [Sanguibacter gelidistatuariae]